MMDWITGVAEDIPDVPYRPAVVEKIRAAIIRHCLFKSGITYNVGVKWEAK